MSLTQLLVPTYRHMLQTLVALLDKAHGQLEGHCAPLLSARLAPDMYPLATQIRFAAYQAQEATFRLLLCHFPGIVRRIPSASFDLILAGHLHAGQISLPLGRRRIGLAHPRAQRVAGIYETPAGLMHVSPGTGTTFVPFRFFARPEVTELVLRKTEERLTGI